MLKGRVFPSHLETRYRYHPWPNRALLAATAAIGTAVQLHLLPAGVVARCFVLGLTAPLALIGHLLAPGTLMQLAGNLFFLWLVGELLCRTLGGLPFLALYGSLGAVSGLAQFAFGSTPVPGADGALAGLLGLSLAVGPTNKATGVFPQRCGRRTFEVPVWVLTLYWIAWSTLGGVLHLWRVPVWGECVGIVTGLTFGLALPKAGLLPLNGAAGASFLDLCRRRRSPQPEMETADPRAELRRLAQVYFEEYSAMPPI
ncbi:MAG TPA: rhomboid family intramembrane serine protease, partial [Opitutaceae bacterium]|nr:rhomboid family intramembrane serine protease [Opitutaceae bacterium]